MHVGIRCMCSTNIGPSQLVWLSRRNGCYSEFLYATLSPNSETINLCQRGSFCIILCYSLLWYVSFYLLGSLTWFLYLHMIYGHGLNLCNTKLYCFNSYFYFFIIVCLISLNIGSHIYSLQKVLFISTKILGLGEAIRVTR